METHISNKIEEFFANYPVREYKKGQVIIFAQDNPGKVFHILEGMVKQYDITYRGDEIILNIFKAPAFFPMSLAINNAENPYIFEAEVDTKMRVAPASEVIDFLKNNPDVTFDLLSRVYKGVDGVLGRMVRLMAGTAKARVMFELLLACRRSGKQQAGSTWTISISEKELGSRSGLSRETVSREISKLAKEGALSLQGGVITIQDIDTFESRLGKVV